MSGAVNTLRFSCRTLAVCVLTVGAFAVPHARAADDEGSEPRERGFLTLDHLDAYLEFEAEYGRTWVKTDDRRPLPADKPAGKPGADDGKKLSATGKWYANPIVKTVVEAFNAEITDIRE